MLLITKIIASSLAFVDGILAQFVTVSAVPADMNIGVPGCTELNVADATLNSCGQGMVAAIASLMSVGIAALNALMMGLLAV